MADPDNISEEVVVTANKEQSPYIKGAEVDVPQGAVGMTVPCPVPKAGPFDVACHARMDYTGKSDAEVRLHAPLGTVDVASLAVPVGLLLSAGAAYNPIKDQETARHHETAGFTAGPLFVGVKVQDGKASPRVGFATSF